MTNNKHILNWVEEMKNLVKPDNIVWIDGSEEQLEKLREESCKSGEILRLDQEKLPGCFYHRTAENDVARVEDRTFICTSNEADAGPTNNWMAPNDAYAKMSKLFDGAMKGRTMYVIPFIMGVKGSPFSKVGVELSDSIYVVLNMAIMTRIGTQALEHLGDSDDFTKCLHGKKDINADERWIMHFPEDNAIWSINSGYGGNVLLGKKCLALRIASYLGRKEGWMAEHMLILGLENKAGEVKYIAAAFPSACGKTNLAMLIPPEILKEYKVYTVGDDIAWLRIGDDGRLWAMNPEAGFFGVAPGTSMKTNPNALLTVQKNTIFTNVMLTNENTVWWEGMDGEAPAKGTDWLGNPWERGSSVKAAHPNSRFTAPASQCPCISSEFEAVSGVPISAIVFGGRRAKTAPLVYQAFDWNHGVFVGATMASETTAAAIGQVGVVRRDPMAMIPFCGYNMGDYFKHWLEMGNKIPNAPKIFHVNWFRTDENGKFIWPGFGDNIRVLNWILDRCDDKVPAVETAIGYLPTKDGINMEGLNLSDEVIAELLSVDKAVWAKEVEGIAEFFAKFGDKLPDELNTQLENLKNRLK